MPLSPLPSCVLGTADVCAAFASQGDGCPGSNYGNRNFRQTCPSSQGPWLSLEPYLFIPGIATRVEGSMLPPIMFSLCLLSLMREDNSIIPTPRMRVSFPESKAAPWTMERAWLVLRPQF